MIDFFQLKNKHIIISGASGGIGEACAIACSKIGAKLTLLGRDLNKLDQVCQSLEGDGHQYFALDLTNIAEFKPVLEASLKENGKFSGFIHAAGMEYTLPLRLHKQGKVEELFRVNVFSAFELCRQICSKNNFVPNGGSLVWISSIMGVCGNPGLLGYSATKGALNIGAKSLALELAPRKIRVNTISPGHLRDTKMSQQKEANLSEEAKLKIEDSHPLGLGSVSDIANAALFLLGECSQWITGTNLSIDGGYSAR